MTAGDSVWKSSALAATYLRGVRGAIPLASEQIEVMLRLVAAAGPPVRRFLDLGCGDGILAEAILSRHPQAAGILLDLSTPMLEAARRRLRARNGQLRFVNADYGQPGWTARVHDLAPFDVVVTGFSIHHQPDHRKRRIYREVFELLCPGGLFLNLEHVSSRTGWAQSVFDDYFVDALHRWHSRQGSRKSRRNVAEEYYHRPDKEANILAPVGQQCRWLERIGFVDVDCYFKVFELAIFGGRRLNKARRS